MATDWAAVRVEFVNSSLQYKELADRHGLKEGTVRQRANREGWMDERNAVSRDVTERAGALLVESRTDELARFNEDDLRVAQAIRLKAEAMMGEVTTPADLKALAGAIDTAQKVGRLALGATTGNTGLSAPNGGPVALKAVHDMTDDELAAIAVESRC